VLSVPFAVFGALVLTWCARAAERRLLPGRAGDPGGLSAKNAILICEFAIERVHPAMAPKEAAIEAAGLRLRAIVMTSLGLRPGCVPLAIATGPPPTACARSAPA